MKRASDLRPPKAFPDVERIMEFDELQEKGDFIIRDFAVREGHYGEFAIILAENDDGLFTTTTGASAVVNLIKLAKAKDELPIMAALKEEVGSTGRHYYTLV